MHGQDMVQEAKNWAANGALQGRWGGAASAGKYARALENDNLYWHKSAA